MAKRVCAVVLATVLFCGAAIRASCASHTILPPGLPFIIDSWSAEEGLPASSVFSITQTRDGYLWLGTLNGLVRFDGLQFTTFDEATPGLNGSRFMQTFEDDSARLWAATETAGAARIDTNGVVTTVEYPPEVAGVRPASICENPAGIWLRFANRRLGRCTDGRVELMPLDCAAVAADTSGRLFIGAGTSEGIVIFMTAATNSVNSAYIQVAPAVQRLDAMQASRNGGFWYLADGRIRRWQESAPILELAPYPWSGNTPVTALCEDEKGNLIVGTYGEGIYWFDSAGKFMHLSDAELSHNSILALEMDREGNLWVGTNGGGLNRVRRRLFGVFPGSEGWVVQTVCEYPAATLWVGYNGESRVDRLAGAKPESLRMVQDAAIAPDCHVKTVFADSSGQVWAGIWFVGDPRILTTNLSPTVNGADGFLERLWKWNAAGHRFEPATGMESLGVDASVLFEDRSKHLWAGTQSGLASKTASGWRLLGPEEGLPGLQVRGIAEDSEGTLWVATSDGLARLQENSITSLQKKDGLPSNDLSSIYCGKDGVIWIGTRSSGLARFQKGQWTRYTSRQGLAGNSIGYIIEDDEGNLWVGSNAGLMRIGKQSLDDVAGGRAHTLDCRTYVEADGLPSRECTLGSQPAVCRSSDGTFWFPTAKGLVSAVPAALKPSQYHSPVMIESIRVSGVEQNTNGLRTLLPDVIEVPPGKEHIEIQYTSLNLGAAKQARFRYRLVGHETEWTYAGDVRVARYSKLPPDRYRFEVTAANQDGIWNPFPASQWIEVRPPFWRTAWFLTVSVIALLSAVVGTVHHLSTQKLQRQVALMRQEEELERERSRIARDLHDQLGANLMQVAMLADMAETDKEQPSEVEEHAKQIGQTARETTRALDEIVWAVNPSNDTLDGLITYICKYAQEYFELAGIRYRLDVPTELPKTPVPPDVRHNIFLAAKEAVNNVVKHAQATEAWLRLRLEPAQFTLEVEDNGRGLGDMDKKSGRNGLRNMRRRLEDAGGSFTISPAPQRGAIVRLTAPIKNHSDH